MTTVPGRQRHCHKLVAETAKAMARDLYEIMMFDNQYRQDALALWPWPMTEAQRVDAFVAKNWSRLIETARAKLAEMLGSPGVSPDIKSTVYDALQLDRTLSRGRRWTRG